MSTKKILVVPDLHGRDFWKQPFQNNPDADKIIFLGDYVDSFDHSKEMDDQMVANLHSIIELKKANPDKVILLWGNHDVQYFVPGQGCSGFRDDKQFLYHRIFADNYNLFELAYHIRDGKGRDYMFTHAGLSTPYLEKFYEYTDYEDLAFQLNIGFNRKESHIFKSGSIRKGGNNLNDVGGPLWADFREFNKNTIPENLYQYVGHTHLLLEDDLSLKLGCKTIYGDSGRITFCDTNVHKVQELHIV